MSARLRFTGPLGALSPTSRQVLIDRSLSTRPEVAATVEALLADVRARGDVALRALAARFDGVTLDSLEVSEAQRLRALDALAPELRRALERAAANLEYVARQSLPPPLLVEVEPGVVVGRRADPVGAVGVYAPGGTAAYPSSVLMGVVPARVAGVREIVVCSPPGREGLPSEVVLAAAQLAGATRVFALGGAGAIGAMAWGTASVPRVDRIVGPGNAWVAEAKRQIAGEVAIDAPAGPSEILVIGGAGADGGAIARELLAQAEHDPDACVVALCLEADLARRVEAALDELVPVTPRRSIVEQALTSRGAVLTVDSLDEAVAFANEFAAEHVQLSVPDPRSVLPRLRNAGTIFVGASTSVAFGDYLTGANHVLPTAGAGRRFSGLSVLDFLRWQTWQEVTPEAAPRLAGDVERLARSEGLPAHAEAARQASGASPHRARVRAPPRLRSTLAEVRRYQPARPPCEIDLTDNTNLFGVPPSVRAVLEAPAPAAVTRYPSPYADGLRAALAKRLEVPFANVATGCGSDDVLDAAFRAFGDPGERVVFCPPTFSIVASFARSNGLEPRAVPLDADAISAARPRLVYLCSPNNPTGAELPVGLLEQFLERSGAVVVVDEAYVEYAGRPSLVRQACAEERLLVVRTLSKAWGLAGLRLGYAVGSARLIEQLEKARGPYKVGALAEACGVAVLTHDEVWVSQRIEAVVRERERFREALVARGLRPLPSAANFLLLPMDGAEAVAHRMRERGVSVRAFTGLEGVGEAVRISIGPRELMEACLTALVEVTS